MSNVGGAQGSLIPQNAEAIWKFLIAAGFSDNAAAGIEGNIFQESGGNPNAGSNPPGKGLIQQLGDPGGSLASELKKMMTYIHANGSVKDINSHASSASAAALYFSEKYERPGIPDNATRQASAEAVLAAAKSGKWPSGSGNNSGGGGTAPAFQAQGGLSLTSFSIPGFSELGNIWHDVVGTASTIGDIATSIQAIAKDIQTVFNFVMVLFEPKFWFRIGAFIVGIFALIVGAIFLGKSVGMHGPDLSKVPIPIPV